MRNLLGASSVLSAEIKVITLPQGKDPDELIKESAEEWQRLITEASPMMDYFFAAASKLDLARPEAKAQASEQLLPLIAEIEDGVQRESYLWKLSRLLDVSYRTLERRAAQLYRTKSERAKGEPLRPSATAGDPLEEYCLSLLLRYPELRDRAGKLSPRHFERSENRELFLAWQADPEAIEQAVDINLRGHLMALSTRPLPPIEEKEREKALADCLRHLEEQQQTAERRFKVESSGIDAIYATEGRDG